MAKYFAHNLYVEGSLEAVVVAHHVSARYVLLVAPSGLASRQFTILTQNISLQLRYHNA